jgi:hypothetical protein
MSRDGGGQHTKVRDLEPRGREAADHGPLDHSTRRRGLAARDDARVALQRSAERGCDAHRDLGREVDVDEPGNTVPAEEP